MRSIGGMAFGIAGLVFAGAAVIFGATVVDAVRVEDVTDSSPPGTAPEPEQVLAGMEEAPPAELESTNVLRRADGGVQASLRGNSYPRVSNNEILDAVNQDIFQPDRTPSVERYLFPSERAAPVRNSRNNRRQREPELRIVGTAIAGDLALAVVQLDDSIPFAVLLGEEVDGFMLAAVGEEMVTLAGTDGEFTLPVVEPRRGRSSNNSRDRNARNQNATQEATQVLTERLQQMLQGRVQMGRGGFTTAEPIRIQPNVLIRTRPGGGGGGGENLP